MIYAIKNLSIRREEGERGEEGDFVKSIGTNIDWKGTTNSTRIRLLNRAVIISFDVRSKRSREVVICDEYVWLAG